VGVVDLEVRIFQVEDRPGLEALTGVPGIVERDPERTIRAILSARGVLMWQP
jgi:hypothetical protein